MRVTTDMVAELVARVLGPARAVTATTDGLRQSTFIVELADRRVIVRANGEPDELRHTEHNLRVLATLGLPVPAVLASDLSLAHEPFAWLVLTYTPGRDLRYELAALTTEQRDRLAAAVVDAQRAVGVLPAGSGYGFCAIGAQAPEARWVDVVLGGHLAPRDEGDDLAPVTARALAGAEHLAHYLDAVRPTCFLDDLTVKNVLVAHGELQGFVDFDSVCYGDPLYQVALTATGIVCDLPGVDLVYVDALLDRFDADRTQRAATALYAALFARDFIARLAATETRAWRKRMVAAADRWTLRALDA
jgi:aminoglycoside phosphotransferase (APT) family kinase protein